MKEQPARTAHSILSAAKVASIAVIALIVELFISQRIASPLGGIVQANYASVSRCILVVLALSGLVLAWKWPVGGGAATVGAIAMIYILDLVSLSIVSSDWLLPLAGVAGLLFLIGGLLLRHEQPNFPAPLAS